jgi:hypothetical protein
MARRPRPKHDPALAKRKAMTDSTNPKRKPDQDQPTLYTPAEVAMFFRVDPKTVTRWARTGTLHPITLPSGHRRYHAEEIHKLLQTGDATIDAPDPEPEPAPRPTSFCAARAGRR